MKRLWFSDRWFHSLTSHPGKLSLSSPVENISGKAFPEADLLQALDHGYLEAESQ